MLLAKPPWHQAARWTRRIARWSGFSMLRCSKAGRPWLFRSRPIGTQFVERDLIEPVGHRLHVMRHRRKHLGPFKSPLVHIKAAVDFKLHRMQPGGRVAVMFGNEAARIGLVAAHRISALPQCR